jgi:amidophosphoribosyltransferase
MTESLLSDEAREECGIFGIHGHPEAVQNTFLGLYALQHRGEESCGIASTNGSEMINHRAMGHVSEALTPAVLDRLRNRTAIGHVRYSTTGASRVENAQPFVASYSGGQIAVAHNGNLVNAAALRNQYEKNGAIFQTTMDTEVIVHVLADPRFSDRDTGFPKGLATLKGAYSLLILTPDEMIAARDPYGLRPLSLGELNGANVIASETCALKQIGATYLRDIEPGEMIRCSQWGVESYKFADTEGITPHHCIFELVYFSRPDSMVFGQNVHEVRKKLGAALAREHPVEADIVIPVPDGGNSAAIGYSMESGIPFDFGFIRNHYIGRTFIQADQTTRSTSVGIKLAPVAEVVKGKRVVVVDDSIVRGTTSRKKIGQLKEAGAKEIHMRVSCPPHAYPCYYGIDFQAKGELIAAHNSVNAIKSFLKLDSLGYLSVDGLLSCVKPPKEHYCTACFTGKYCCDPEDEMNKFGMEAKTR